MNSRKATIYRPFFRTGIVVAVGVGALWGTYLLLRIASSGSFTAINIHEVNAHGHAMIFGWVGLFVMGFAYHMFPRFKGVELRYPRLALVSFWVMLTGIVLRSGSQAFADRVDGLMALAVAGSLLEIAAIACFISIMVSMLRSGSQRLEAYDGFILSALFWFLVQAVYGTGYFIAIASAPTREILLDRVATWQGPLRDLQIHGFAMMMVLGVSHPVLHRFFRLPLPSVRTSLAALALVNLGVCAEALGLSLMRAAGRSYVALWYGGVLAILAAVVILVRAWRIYGADWRPGPSVKFIQAAYTWLLISLTLAALLPVYQFGALRVLAPDSSAYEIGFSHAYYGAVRHAITVGFISMMIVGVAAKSVPIMTGAGVDASRPLWLPFLLLNTGCAMRVGFQIQTDFTEMAFPLTAVSGLFEFSALALWGLHLWREMDGQVSVRQLKPESAQPLTRGNA